MSLGRLLLLGPCFVLFVTSCMRDLSVPETQVGSVRGLVQAKGQPVAAVTLQLASETPGGTAEVTTGDDGAFLATNLAAGLWTATAVRPGFLPLEKTFTISAGAVRDLGVLSLYAEAPDVETAGTITGVVRLDGADSAQLQGGTVEVLLQPGLRRLATAALGSAGLFAAQVPPGTYSVRATHPYFVTTTAPDLVVLARQETVVAEDRLVMALNPGRVAGRVLKEVDPSTSGGASAPVPAANVTVSADTGASTTTAMDGTFELAGLVGGTRTLRFSLAGLHDAQGNRVAQVTPATTTTLTDVQLSLDRGDVLGSVEMSDGSPLRDVTVFLDGTSYSAAAVPSPADPARGTFRLGGIPVGTYSLSAVRAGYRSVSSGAFTVTANAALTLPTLPRLTRLQGDFAIDDFDATNTPGFARRREVLLVVNNPTGVAAFRAAETDPAAAALPFVPFGADGGTAIAFVLSPGDGEKTVSLQLEDNLGSRGPVLTASVVLDTTAPVATDFVLDEGTGFTRQANPVPFSLAGNDPGALGVVVSGVAFMRLSTSATVDAGGHLAGPRQSYQRDATFTRASSAEGPVTLFAQLLDNAGNVSAPVTATVEVDVTAPSGTLTIQQGAEATLAGTTQNPLVTLLVTTAPEPGGGAVRVRLANALPDVDRASPVPVATGLAWFLDPLGDGTKTVSYRLVDSAGNLSPVQSASVVLDRVAPAPLAPATTLATLGSPALTTSRSGTLVPTVQDDRRLAPLAILLEVAGATSELAPSGTTTSTAAVPFTLPDVDGPANVRVRFKDAAGNLSPSMDFTVTLDRRAPTGSFSVVGTLADGSSSSTHTASATVRLLLNQEGATRAHFTTGALAACPTTAASYVPLGDPTLEAFLLGAADAPYTVRGCLRDEAGNTALLAAASPIVLDRSTPLNCALLLTGTRRDGTAPPAGLTASASVTATLQGCTESPVEYWLVESSSPVACTATAAAWEPLAGLSPRALPGLDGAKTLRGCVRDAARNVGSLAAATITLDTTPPVAAAVSIDADARYVNASQVVAGLYAASLTGLASGATEWAVGTTSGPTNFLAFPANNPRALSIAVAGSGPVRAYARFRDAVGNETEVSDDLEADLTAPPAPAVSVQPTGAAGYVNSEVVTVRLASLGDARQVLVAGAVTAALCTTALAAALPQPAAPTLTLLLSPTEGAHVVCARSLDEAGNLSVTGQTSVTLDLTPPTRPVILTPDATLALADGTFVAITTASPSTDTNFAGYERLDPTVTRWTALAPSGPSTQFNFPVRNDGTESGFRNELRLRAVDLAGNASADSAVIITADTNAPDTIEARASWIDNGNGRGSLYWVAPTLPDGGRPDIAGYHVYYGGTQGFSDGEHATFATEGTSPVLMAAQERMTLSGLPNGTPTYVRVRPFDFAGNEGTGAWLRDGGTQPLALQPDEVSPNEVASISFGASAVVHDVVVSGNVLFAVHSSASCTAAPQPLLVSAVDLGQLPSPIEGGQAQSAQPGLTVAATLTLPSEACQNFGNNAALTLSGDRLFVSTPTTVYDVDVSEPLAPASAGSFASIAMTPGSTSFAARSFELLGNKAVLAGRSVSGSNTWFAGVLDVSALFDGNAATTLASATVVGSVGSASVQTARSAVLLRDRVIVNAGAEARLANLGPTLATGALPTYQGLSPTNLVMAPGAPAGGNLLYTYPFAGGLSAFSATDLWSGGTTLPAVSSSSTFGQGRMTVQGRHAYLWDLPTLRVVDFQDLAAPVETGHSFVTSQSTTFLATTRVFGNYLVLAGAGNAGLVRLFELATPRSLRVATTTLGAGNQAWPGTNLLYTSRGAVFDLQAGPTPAQLGTASSPNCETNSAFAEGLELRPRQTGFEVVNLEALTDRNPATSGTPTYSVTLTGSAVTDLDLYGNHLVAAEVRATGLFLEVFNASKLHNRAGVALTSADSVGAVQVTSTAPDARTVVTVAVRHGRAIVGIDPYQATSDSTVGSHLYVVELGNLLDDSAATSGGVVHGPVMLPHVFDVELQGPWAYAATGAGLWIVDVKEAMDASPVTVVPPTPTTRQVASAQAFDGLSVHGNTVLLAPRAGAVAASVLSVGVADPLSPRVNTALAYTPSGLTCGTSPSTRSRVRIVRAGPLAYVTSAGTLTVLELE